MKKLILIILFPIVVYGQTPTPTPCIFVVNNTGDADDSGIDCVCDTGISTGVCTFRAAKDEVNGCHGGCLRSEVDFNIPNTDPNCQSNSCLILTDGTVVFNPNFVQIKGTTQPFTVCPTTCDGSGRFFGIIIAGSSTQHTSFADAVTLNGTDSFIEGVRFVDFAAPLGGAGGACVLIQGDRDYVRCSEFTFCGNGIIFSSKDHVQIGGPNPNDRVMMVGNSNTVTSTMNTNTLIQNITIKSSIFPGILSINDNTTLIDSCNIKYDSQDGTGIISCTNCSITNNIVGLDCNGIDPFGNGLRPICNAGSFSSTDGKECFSDIDCPVSGNCSSSPAVHISGTGFVVDSNLIGSNFGSGIDESGSGNTITNNVIGWDISQTLDRCNGQPQVNFGGSGDTISGNNINPACLPSVTPTPTLTPTPTPVCVVIKFTPGSACDSPPCSVGAAPTIGPDEACGDNTSIADLAGAIPLCSDPTPGVCGAGCCIDRQAAGDCNSGCIDFTPTFTPTLTPTTTPTPTITPTQTPCGGCPSTPTPTWTRVPTRVPSPTWTRVPTP